jgi:hypothetical protein
VKAAGYVALFAAIQLVNLPLTVVGWFILAFYIFVWRSLPRWTWVWQNDDDAWFNQYPKPVTRWDAFDWLALRNPVANLRHVPGVSKVGRPLYYRTWLVKGKQFYLKCGWMSDGYPALSAGSGRGY